MRSSRLSQGEIKSRQSSEETVKIDTENAKLVSFLRWSI